MATPITSADDLTDRVANRLQIFDIFRDQSLITASGGLHSLWVPSSGIPGPGVAPTTPAVPTSATAGALCAFTDPTSGDFAHLFALDLTVTNPVATPILYDRLSHMGGLDGTSVASQTVNTAAITRGDTTGAGVLGFLECYTNLGGSGTTATVTYTNQAGTGSRTATVTIPSTLRAGRLLPIPLQSGDTGIRSVQSVQLAGSTGTAGNFGVTLARRIATVPATTAHSPVHRIGIELGLPRIDAGACLWLVLMATTTTAGTVSGGISIITTG